MSTFGLKIRETKRGTRLPKHVLDLLRKKEQTCINIKEAFRSNDIQTIDKMNTELTAIKQEINDKICKFRLRKRHKIRSRMLKNDPSRKKFWSFIKNQMKIAGQLTACYDKERKVVFEQGQIEEAVLGHFQERFKGQRTPVYSIGGEDDPDYEAVNNDKEKPEFDKGISHENKYIYI